MIILRELGPQNDAEWDSIVVASPRGLLFHLSDWLSLVRDSQRLQLVRLGIFDGKEPVGVFPLFLRRFGPLTVAGSPFVVEDTHYLGPVVEDASLARVMELFSDYMRVRGINYSRIILRHDWARQPFTDLGYDCMDNLTHIVDLKQDPETLWKRVKSPCQRQIRKAARAGVTTEIVRDDRYLDSYYRLVEDLYARQSRTPPSPVEFFHGVWSRFGTKGDLVWVVAKHEGDLAAGALLALWKGSVYYLDGVSSSAHTGLGSSNAMHWAAIQWAKTEGFSFYDFVGSNVARFFQFKSSFGGDLTTYLILERSRPTWVRTLRHHYARYKGFLQRIK